MQKFKNSKRSCPFCSGKRWKIYAVVNKENGSVLMDITMKDVLAIIDGFMSDMKPTFVDRCLKCGATVSV